MTVISPEAVSLRAELAEIWEYRELLRTLVWRDIAVRYKQTLLGVGWVAIQPLVSMAIFTLVFGRLARMPSQGVPYAVFTLAAIVPWAYFAQAVTGASMCIVEQRAVITKVFLPRLVLPLVPLASGLVDLVVSLTILLIVCAIVGVFPGMRVLALPLLVLLAALTALAVGLWVSALNALYRDFRHLLPFLVQVLLFVTPVVYPSSLVPERWRLVYAVNPMASVVEGFRWALFHVGPGPGAALAVSVGSMFVILLGGAAFFRRMERSFVDVL